MHDQGRWASLIDTSTNPEEEVSQMVFSVL